MTRDDAIALARIFRATRPDCNGKRASREFRQWSATRDHVAAIIEECHVMSAPAWTDLTEPSEAEVWEKRKRKFPGG